MFRILNNFGYIDHKFIIEAFKAWQYAFSALKEVVFCLLHLYMFRILNNFSYIDNKFIKEAFKAW